MATRFEDIRKRVAARQGVFTAGIELTYRCNLQCVHCYCVVGGPRRELTTDEHLKLLDELAAAGCLSITLTGGEALLRPDFFEIAAHARSLHFAMRLFTNGILLDESTVRRIRELEFLSVDISLYGASEKTYERVTGHGAFEKVRAAIERLQVAGQRLFIKMPLMQENFADLDAMVDYCRQRGLSYNIDPWMTPKDDGTMGPTGSQITDEQLRDFLRRYGKKIAPNKQRDPGKALCTIGRGSVIVGPYGDVFGCVQSKLPVGNIRERPVVEIWREAELLERERALRFRDFVECKACEFHESCFICPAISLFENGRFNGPNRYSCKISQMRYELGQIESRPVLFQIEIPGKAERLLQRTSELAAPPSGRVAFSC